MAMVNIQALSPAKVNLMLRVLGQRDDGYHDLQTCFQILDWGDSMTFVQSKENGSNQLKISGFDGLKSKNNLIYKAAQKLIPWAQKNSDWRVDVEKNIPAGAGLGGGSSNAATTLKILNQQWQCGLSDSQLMEVGNELGADVPLFIASKSALATGTGNQMIPMLFDTPYVLLIFPETQISTAEVFNHVELNRSQNRLSEQYINNSNFWINDFMPLVLNEYAEVKHIYDHLKGLFRLHMSGSGSTLFAVFDRLQEAELAMDAASKYTKCLIVTPQSWHDHQVDDKKTD